MRFHYYILRTSLWSLIFKAEMAFFQVILIKKKKKNRNFMLGNILISYMTGESWFSRSLFVVGGHVFLCFEDLMQFSTLCVDASSLPLYFSLDLCCSIADISELVMPDTFFLVFPLKFHLNGLWQIRFGFITWIQ